MTPAAASVKPWPNLPQAASDGTAAGGKNMGEETTFNVVDLGRRIATSFYRRGVLGLMGSPIKAIQRLESENERRYTGAFPR